MSVLRSLLTAGVLVLGMFWTVPGQTEPASQTVTVKRWTVMPQRNPDEACLQCHKPEEEGMKGKHAKAMNPQNRQPITCTSCHGKPSLHHREGIKDVMRFNDPMYTVEQQNGVCMSCHTPKQLQKAFWPHDVHMTKVACASCHQLHPTQDKMQGLDDKGRIKLCVDCHSDQRTNPAFNPSSVHVGQRQP